MPDRPSEQVPGVRRLSNFVGGAPADPIDGSTTMLIDPSTADPYLEAPVSGPLDVDAAMRAALER